MKFEHTQVMNFEGAFRGLRNPKNSWERSDSIFGVFDINADNQERLVAEKWMNADFPGLDKNSFDYENCFHSCRTWLLNNGILHSTEDSSAAEVAFIGPNDMRLAQNLIRSGSEHRKFLRQIFVSVDITAPIFLWKELDTYKVGTSANSTSTMHKITSKPITLDCFEIDDFNKDLKLTHNGDNIADVEFEQSVINIINLCEKLRRKYIETKDKRYWKELIRWLPEGWLQTRTWTCNYEILLRICQQRANHKLSEWKQFLDWCKTLPYADNLLFDLSVKY